jgi:ribulose-bisphosphate carboxylase large chain
VVICVKGAGMIRVNRNKRQMDYMDIIYISPDTPHQFINPFRKPFGFFCIVNARRDRPELMER